MRSRDLKILSLGDKFVSATSWLKNLFYGHWTGPYPINSLRTGSMNIADSFSFYFASVGFYLYNVVTDISMSAYASCQTGSRGLVEQGCSRIDKSYP